MKIELEQTNGVVVVCFVLWLGAAMCAKAEERFPLTARFHLDGSEIVVEIENTSESEVSVYDVPASIGSAPGFLSIKVRDENQLIRSSNKVDERGYWTSTYLSSYSDNEIQRPSVRIGSGEKWLSKVHIRTILTGLDTSEWDTDMSYSLLFSIVLNLDEQDSGPLVFESDWMKLDPEIYSGLHSDSWLELYGGPEKEGDAAPLQ